jgi:hypothetical protein
MMILKQGNNRAKRTNCIIKDPAIRRDQQLLCTGVTYLSATSNFLKIDLTFL